MRKKGRVIALLILFLLLPACGIKEERKAVEIKGEKIQSQGVFEKEDARQEDARQEDSWKETHLSLDKQYTQVSVTEDMIYGCYNENQKWYIDFFSKTRKEIEKKVPVENISDILDLTADTEGNLYVVCEKEKFDTSLLRIDKEGNMSEKGNLVLEEVANAEFLTIQGILLDKQGRVYIWSRMALPLAEVLEEVPKGQEDVYAMTDRIYMKDAQWNTEFYEQVPDMDGTRLLKFDLDSEGTPFFLVKDSGDLYYQKVDLENKKLLEEVRLEDMGMSADNASNEIIMQENGFLFCRGSVLYQYDNEKEECERVLDFLSYGITPSDILYLGMQEGALEIIDYYQETGHSEYTTLVKGQSEKTIVTLGVMQASQSMEAAVSEFNRYSTDTRVALMQYYEEKQTFEEGLERLKLDIVSGKAPDIIEVSGIDYAMLADKGVLADLLPYMQKEEGCRQEDMMPSVRKAYMLNGHLYSIAPSFQLYTMWGKDTIINKQSGLTLSELKQLLKNHDKSLNHIWGFSADEPVLTTLCTFGMDEFIDWEAGTCDFASEYFTDILTFAREYKGGYSGSVIEGVQNGQIVMSVGVISSVANYQIQKELYGGDLSFVGYPTSKGSGTAIGLRGDELAINANAGNPEKAWEFVKYYLLNGYKGQGFPVLKAQFEEAMKAAGECEMVVSEEGTYRAPKGTFWDDGDCIEVYEADAQDIEAIRNLVETAVNSYDYNTNILNIINEEAQPFLIGQKTAEEATQIIQKRVQLYLQEQRE